MIASIYNNIVEYNGNCILFNALYMKFLFLQKEIAQLYIENKKNPISIREIHPDFYEALVKYGFVVSEKKDEIADAKSLIEKINSEKSSYRLILNPTLNCNFHCWYCYENHNGNTKMDANIITRIEHLLSNISKNSLLRNFQLSFFGGEPLLFYSEVLFPIAKYAFELFKNTDKNFYLDITTNGYLLDINRIKELRALGLCSCQITFDGNKNHHDATRYIKKGLGSYDTIISNVKNAVKEGISIVLRINYTEENLNGLSSIFDDLKDLSLSERKRLTLSMNKVWQEKNNKLGEKVKGFQKQAKSFGITLPDALLSDRVRNSCYADKENEAVINYNGNVYKCNARNFTSGNSEGYLDESGNIIWNDLHELKKSSKMSNHKCLSCSIFPICGGGCSQISYDNRKCNYCVNDNPDIIKDMIVEMFLSENTKSIDS